VTHFEIGQAKGRRMTPAAFAMVGASPGYFGGGVVVVVAGAVVDAFLGTPELFTAMLGCSHGCLSPRQGFVVFGPVVMG
jgi:hypothetical protein